MLAATYTVYHRGLIAHYGLAQGLGNPPSRRRSIPQGCPWSNFLLVILPKPLLLHLKAMAMALPR